MEGPPLGPGGEDTTWPHQVAPRGQKASSTRKIKPQTSNPRRSAVAAPGVQGHFRLARVGDSVDSLLDVHAAARGLIQNRALRHPVAQGGACGRVPHRRQHSVIGAGSGVSLGAPVFSGAVAPIHAGQRAGTLPAGGVNSAGVLPAGGSGIISRLESAPASSCGRSPSPALTPSALMTWCAASSVGDRRRVLRGAAGSAIVVSLCLRAGDGVRISGGWCTCCGRGGAWVGELERWLRGLAFACSCGH